MGGGGLALELSAILQQGTTQYDYRIKLHTKEPQTMKASQVQGTATEGANALEAWQYYGQPLIIDGVKWSQVKEFQGKPTLSVVATARRVDNDELIEIWVPGQQAKVVADFFLNPNNKGETMEGTFYLNPVVGSREYRGWTLLDWEVQPDDHETPKKAMEQLYKETQRARREGNMPFTSDSE